MRNKDTILLEQAYQQVYENFDTVKATADKGTDIFGLDYNLATDFSTAGTGFLAAIAFALNASAGLLGDTNAQQKQWGDGGFETIKSRYNTFTTKDPKEAQRFLPDFTLDANTAEALKKSVKNCAYYLKEYFGNNLDLSSYEDILNKEHMGTATYKNKEIVVTDINLINTSFKYDVYLVMTILNYNAGEFMSKQYNKLLSNIIKITKNDLSNFQTKQQPQKPQQQANQIQQQKPQQQATQPQQQAQTTTA
jgi:hypothetical protein